MDSRDNVGIDKDTFGEEYHSYRYSRENRETVSLNKSDEHAEDCNGTAWDKRHYGDTSIYTSKQICDGQSIPVEDKVLAAISYISMLWLVPLILKERSAFVLEHLNNALNIWLINLIMSIGSSMVIVVAAVPVAYMAETTGSDSAVIVLGAFTVILMLLLLGVSLAIAINSIMGFVNACTGKMPKRWFLANQNFVK